METIDRSQKTRRKAMRRRQYRKFMNEYGRYIAAGVFLLAVVVIVSLAAVMASSGEEKEKQTEAAESSTTAMASTTPEATPEAITEAPEEVLIDNQYPFNQMSRDWGAEDIAGFIPYTIPQEYTEAGGAFPDVMQKYTYIICNQNAVDYAVVLAMIEVESDYRWDAAGKTDDVGYMQIVPEWHKDRMERLQADDLLNPFQNVSVGVDFIAELLGKYGGDYGKALTAYQYGASGAYKYFFSAGVYSSEYAENVLEIADRIRTEMGGGQDDVR